MQTTTLIKNKPLTPDSKPLLTTDGALWWVSDAPTQTTTPRRTTRQAALDDWTALTAGGDAYAPLRAALLGALEQAAYGKGRERHANDLPFLSQPLFDTMRSHGVGFATGQAAKKLAESHGMDSDAAVHEIYGAIVYAAAAAIWRGIE